MKKVVIKKLIVFTLPLTALLLNGCVALLGASTDEPIDMDPNKRTFGTMVDDQQLETIAAVNIDKASPDLKSAPIAVTSYNRVLLLTGQVKSNELRELAGRTAAQIDKVRQVHNELTVQAPIGFMGDTNDAWLTTKVKSKLLADKEVRANKIKVVTEGGTVYLMGLIPRSEAEAAAELARGTAGVQKVVLAIEYTDQ